MKPAPAPDFAKIRAALAAREPRLTEKALSLVSAAPIHIRPKPVHMKLPPVDAARRGITRSINPAAARFTFGNLPCNTSR